MTREQLIDLCERATVAQDKWTNRDSASAQKQVGEAWALLRAGCEFEIDGEIGTGDHGTHWIKIKSEGFSFREGSDALDTDTFYIPSSATLAKAADRNGRGGDWYSVS